MKQSAIRFLLFALLLAVKPITAYSDSAITVHVATAGTLLDYIGIENIENITSLTVSGNLNGTDILVIRKMTNLNYLNMTDATIVDGGLSYYENYTTSKDKIGKNFFYHMESLLEVLLPLNITSIGHGAFEGCTSLASIIIPNSVTTIEDWAFYANHSLTSVVIPNSVTSIGIYCFAQCNNLTSIIIPNSVKSIGGDAFSGSGLISVTIPDGVTSIEYGLFSNCANLISVTIPNSVTSIGRNAFYGCHNLSSVTIPHKVTSIGSGAFWVCSSLTSITSLNPTPPLLQRQTFDDATNKNAILYVPTGCKTIYWLHPYWEYFSNIEEIDVSDVKTIKTDDYNGIGNGKVYNLNGELLRANPDDINNLPKGIYIIYGQKVVIK